MMTLTDVSILFEAEDFGDIIVESEVFHHYIETKEALLHDELAQKKLAHFSKLKEKYEEVQRFGKYHPDFRTVTTEVREYKRTVDTEPSIAAFKKAEKELETLLREVSEVIAHNVSPQIMVPTGNPFFDAKGCSGGCGSGGSCSCSA
ncbi:YlbF family regulator [Paenalkalicoccus suaedae]|uniref:YlbF family regulator n=1 Tax=Paenalkalicoccus suaedae TaxID=2592382 RepID=A0A859FFZ3_9BACI|nr:YlbF family regulator [Paenalkalicoccus suaedae]QKS71544.1 YlbF family regulator [Paenalkalicoccus suaedae]